MVEPIDPVPGLLNRLPEDAAVVRRAGFAHLYSGGAPVTVAEMAADCGMSEPKVEAALAALVGIGTATRDADGRLVGVGGLSVVPAAHLLVLAGRQFFTWCAFDAVGIPAALGLDAVARTACGHCAKTLEVVLRAGVPKAGDGALVGWLPGGPCSDVQADFCPAANLFCDRGHLDAWREGAGGPDGRVASLAELAAEGRKVWAEIRPAAV